MTGKRLFAHSVFLILLPLVVAWFVRVERENAPPAMREDIERWIEMYPNATAFISRLYEQERGV